jgi:hypothetical protein
MQRNHASTLGLPNWRNSSAKSTVIWRPTSNRSISEGPAARRGFSVQAVAQPRGVPDPVPLPDSSPRGLTPPTRLGRKSFFPQVTHRTPLIGEYEQRSNSLRVLKSFVRKSKPHCHKGSNRPRRTFHTYALYWVRPSPIVPVFVARESRGPISAEYQGSDDSAGSVWILSGVNQSLSGRAIKRALL